MCPISTALLVIAAILALIYVFLTWNFGYWKQRGIPTAKSWPFVGSFPSVFTQKRNVVYDIDEIYEQYKHTDSIVGVFQTRIPQLMVTTPEYAHKIFVNDFRSFHDNEMAKFTDTKKDPILSNNPFILTGEAWKERRAEVTPGLSANRVKAAYPVTQRVCKKFVEYIRRQSLMAPTHGLNAKDLCLCYTTEVISDCVLGISAQSFTDNPTPMVGMTKRVFEQSFGFIFYTVVANLWPPITKFYSVSLFAKDVADFFYDIMRKCIQVRRESPAAQQRDDFLNYMLQLQEKKGLDAVELTSHTMTFLTDGFETTAQVLTHTLLFLARNPEEQRKLRQEVGTTELSYEQISELPFAEACIHETLRIFPPGLVARKVVTEPYEIANKNGVSVKLSPGDVVIIPINALHNDAQYYEEPQSYNPERFLDINGGAKKYRDQGVYFGFGDGPRICPGMRFSVTQIKAALVEIVRNFDIKVNPKTRQDNTIDDTYFMAALKGGVWLDFVERK
ncbi:probable cytochrome P450 28d1 [Drosophila erecta]|nr:probable cytochrome P450 28d1 [Drosophila erecta]